MITPLHNQKLLVGSRAIQYYFNLERPLKDWDIWQEQSIPNNQIIQGELIDYHQISDNEYKLIQALDVVNLPTIDTPVGPAKVTPLWFNFLLKASHYSINKKAKHLQDFNRLSQLTIVKPKVFDELLLQRFQDTQLRQSVFFDESVPRLLPHDWIHLQVAIALGHNIPAFISLVNSDNYSAPESEFLKLSYELQNDV